jgi:hypothetical protein
VKLLALVLLTASAAAKPQILIDGKPLAVDKVFVTSGKGRATVVHFADRPLTCADIERGHLEVPLRILLARSIEGPTDVRLRVVEVAHEFVLMTLTDEQRRATSGADAVHVDAQLTFRAAHRIQIDGALEVERCNAVRRDEPDRPQHELRVELGPLEVPVHAATLRRVSGGWELALRSVPIGCQRAASIFDEELLLAIALDDKMHIKRVEQLGWLFAPSLRSSTARNLTVKLGNLRSDDVQAEINGTAMFGAIPLKIAGHVTAQKCK